MIPGTQELQPAALDDTLKSRIVHFYMASWVVAEMELRKLLRDPTEMLFRAVQPVLWLVIFGQVMGHIHAIPTGTVSYQAFLTPGILAQSVLFSAIFYGIAVIWERDLGIVHKLLVSPASRLALVFGKALSAGFRGLGQSVIIYLVALTLKIDLDWRLRSIFGVFLGVMLGSAIFSTLSLTVACLVKTRERFMGIGQVMTMPLFFASNAIYPLEFMPAWLRFLAALNPLTYLVDVLRYYMIGRSGPTHLMTDFGVLSAAFIVLLAIAAKMYPALAR